MSCSCTRKRHTLLNPPLLKKNPLDPPDWEAPCTMRYKVYDLPYYTIPCRTILLLLLLLWCYFAILYQCLYMIMPTPCTIITGRRGFRIWELMVLMCTCIRGQGHSLDGDDTVGGKYYAWNQHCILLASPSQHRNGDTKGHSITYAEYVPPTESGNE